MQHVSSKDAQAVRSHVLVGGEVGIAQLLLNGAKFLLWMWLLSMTIIRR